MTYQVRVTTPGNEGYTQWWINFRSGGIPGGFWAIMDFKNVDDVQKYINKHLEPYNARMLDGINDDRLEFASESDYTFFLLRWS